MMQNETEKYQNLYNAVIYNDVALVNQLVQDGLDVNHDFQDLHVNRGEATNVCRYLLVESAANNQSEMVDTLLSHGANINVQEKDGTTALMQAVYADSLTLVYLLLSHGAAVEVEDNQNRTALHLAAQLNRTKIIDGIIHHHRVTNPLMVDLLNANGETPLIFAIKNGQFTAADILILRGADPNKADKDGRSPLHFAVELEDERLTKYLLRNLAFPYKIDMLGILPIALSTVPLIISYLEDAYAQYSAEFRMYEEMATTCGLSRLLRYQFIHLLHFYEDFRRQRSYSSFDLAAAMVGEDWDSVQQHVLSKAWQAAACEPAQLNAHTTPTRTSQSHSISLPQEKSILAGCFFSYDANEFYKQTMIVLQGVTIRLQMLGKEYLSGNLGMTELYACAKVRQKLQSFILSSSPVMQQQQQQQLLKVTNPNSKPGMENAVTSSSVPQSNAATSAAIIYPPTNMSRGSYDLQQQQNLQQRLGLYALGSAETSSASQGIFSDINQRARQGEEFAQNATFPATSPTVTATAVTGEEIPTISLDETANTQSMGFTPQEIQQNTANTIAPEQAALGQEELDTSSTATVASSSINQDTIKEDTNMANNNIPNIEGEKEPVVDTIGMRTPPSSPIEKRLSRRNKSEQHYNAKATPSLLPVEFTTSNIESKRTRSKTSPLTSISSSSPPPSTVDIEELERLPRKYVEELERPPRKKGKHTSIGIEETQNNIAWKEQAEPLNISSEVTSTQQELDHPPRKKGKFAIGIEETQHKLSWKEHVEPINIGGEVTTMQQQQPLTDSIQTGAERGSRKANARRKSHST